ncbi:hypothetical protein PL8927_50207 [Planktothrix serta PCC 8927]|uniref:Uncharacterized protein n=1 Tax=Planktothrix serta PCC 8927 TaxID=671068 RepID=A0A7Z9DYH0_9CYAN|nr:hypothetical protein [Planktothrix serta]VXD15779.1 hypothetical protein PL8927_50207 [Planktothrix serta PCC 8927]
MEFLFCYGSTSTVAGVFYSQHNSKKAQELWSSIQKLIPPSVLENLEHTITQELEALMRIG